VNTGEYMFPTGPEQEPWKLHENFKTWKKTTFWTVKATEMTWNEDQISLLCKETISEIHVLYSTFF
jgi:hypothetical protein